MNRIKELRKSRKINQTELAKILNVQQGTISNWEKEQTEIDFSSLKKIATFFNVTTDYILGIEEQNKIVIPQNTQEARVAFYGGVEKLNQNQMDKVAEYIEFLKSQNRD